jgi:DNA-binding response OmpR family regulator
MWILVVEDDPTTSVLLEKALREEGHTVVVERNGAARRRALPNARTVRAGCVRCVRRRLADEEKTIKNC